MTAQQPGQRWSRVPCPGTLCGGGAVQTWTVALRTQLTRAGPRTAALCPHTGQMGQLGRKRGSVHGLLGGRTSTSRASRSDRLRSIRRRSRREKDLPGSAGACARPARWHLLGLDSEVTTVHLQGVDLEISLRTVNRVFRKRRIWFLQWGPGRHDQDRDGVSTVKTRVSGEKYIGWD